MTPQETINKLQTLDILQENLPDWFFDKQITKNRDRTENINDSKLYSDLMPLYFAQYIFMQFLKPLHTHSHPICIHKHKSCFKITRKLLQM